MEATNITSKDIPVSEILAKFAHDLTFQDSTFEVKAKLKELLLDYIGVASAASADADSSEPIYQGIMSFDSQRGSNTVFKKGQKYLPLIVALLNGALSHSFDFDDTFAKGCLHPGTSIISAILAQAEFLQSTTQDTLTALAVGYEVVCRIAMQLREGSYKRGFHSTATAGIFGCVAAIASLRKIPAKTIEMAFGLGGQKRPDRCSF